MRFLVATVSIVLIAILVMNYENIVYGQYFPCNNPKEVQLFDQETKYVLKFEGNECDNYDMTLQINQGEKITELDLNEKATRHISIKMEVIQDNLYLVWTDADIKFVSRVIEWPSLSVIPTPISIKQISLDGTNIGKTTELDFQNYYSHRIIDLVEINDEIWLFWVASGSGASEGNIIKSQIKNQDFVDHKILVKEKFITIKKVVNLNESELYMIFFTMNYGCEEYYQKDVCKVNYETFALATSPRFDQGSVYGIIPTPYQLIKMGIPPKDVLCKIDLQLYYKDGNIPLCVKPFTGLRLFERGWNITNQIEEISKK